MREREREGGEGGGGGGRDKISETKKETGLKNCFVNCRESFLLDKGSNMIKWRYLFFFLYSPSSPFLDCPYFLKIPPLYFLSFFSFFIFFLSFFSFFILLFSSTLFLLSSYSLSFYVATSFFSFLFLCFFLLCF